MQSDESNLSHAVSYVYLTNNGQGKPGTGAICLILDKNVLQSLCVFPALRIFIVTFCTAGKLELEATDLL